MRWRAAIFPGSEGHCIPGHKGTINAFKNDRAYLDLSLADDEQAAGDDVNQLLWG